MSMGPTGLLASVGPMTFGEHAMWFVVLSLVTFLVYHGLRADTLGEAVSRGLKRWVMFAAGTAVLGGAFHMLVRVL
jgi:hypothetical protein